MGVWDMWEMFFSTYSPNRRQSDQVQTKALSSDEGDSQGGRQSDEVKTKALLSDEGDTIETMDTRSFVQLRESEIQFPLMQLDECFQGSALGTETCPSNRLILS